MKNSVFEELKNSEAQLFQNWLQNMRQVGRVKHICISREDCLLTLKSFLAILHHGINGKDINPFDIVMRDSDSFLRSLICHARNWRETGLGLADLIFIVKLLVQTIEDALLQQESFDCKKSHALHDLRRKANIIESAIILDWEKTGNQENARDVHERYRRLLADKKRYEWFFQTTANLAIVCNAEGVVIEANPEAMTFFGGRKVVGRYCWELLQLGVNTLPMVFQRYAPGKEHMITLHTESGEFFLEMRCFQFDASLVQQQVLFVLNDISRLVGERKAHHRNVRERSPAGSQTEKLLEAVVSSVAEGILLIDEDREIIKANPRSGEIFGILEQNLIGTDIRSLVDATGAALMEEYFGQLVEGQRMSGAMNGLYVDGSPVPLTITIARIDLDRKKYWAIVLCDNTEREAMAENLRCEMKQVEDVSSALKTILQRSSDERRKLENSIASRIRDSLLPAIRRLARESDVSVRKQHITLLEDQLVSLTSWHDAELEAAFLRLSKTELEICRLIRSGAGSKDISEVLNISVETVHTHRKKIRKKLGLSNKKVNIRTFLDNRSF